LNTISQHDDHEDQHIQPSQPQRPTHAAANPGILSAALVGQARDPLALGPGGNALSRRDGYEDERQHDPQLREGSLLSNSTSQDCAIGPSYRWWMGGGHRAT
jgi:hypothetical protein